MKIMVAGAGKNDCIFCADPKNIGADNDLATALKTHDFSRDDRVIFSDSEPTLRADICTLLTVVRNHGVAIRQINSSGRRFSDRMFSEQIIAAGASHFKISLHGHSSRLHDRVTGCQGSFQETVQGLRNLVRLGQKDRIVVCVALSRANYGTVHRILGLVKRLGIRKVQLNAARADDAELLPLETLGRYVAFLRERFLFDLLIKVNGIPYCLIPSPESLFLRPDDTDAYCFLAACAGCKYQGICPGVLKSYAHTAEALKVKPVPDLPVEVMIEVESRCNFECAFCFNRVSFASRGFGEQKLESFYIKEIIDGIKKAGISTVRFTGGEPLLRDDLLGLIKYARAQGLLVRLNTNGSLIESFAMVKELAKHLDYVLFAMHACDPRQEEAITGFRGSFERKIRAMKWFKAAGIKVLRVNTIASAENIQKLEKFYALFKKLKVDRWAVNRLIPFSVDAPAWGATEAALLIKKLTKIKRKELKRKTPMWIHIVNAIPLCAGDPVAVSAVSSGGRAVDGHERFAVDPRGFAKPIYYMDENIGDPRDPLACWNHPFLRSIRSYALLPDECRQCALLDRCKGGNRHCARAAHGDYRAPDPLMDLNNVKDLIW